MSSIDVGIRESMANGVLRGYLRLTHGKDPGRLRLRELPVIKQTVQGISQTQLGLTLGGIRKPKVNEDFGRPLESPPICGLARSRPVQKYNSRRIMLSMAYCLLWRRRLRAPTSSPDGSRPSATKNRSVSAVWSNCL
jgi:hypothetical protein